jgi:probable F420-dependent oxidoreductase
MQIGCHLPTQGPVATREALTTFCQQAERRGIASLWVSDHVVFPTVGNDHYPSGRFPHAPHTAYLEPVAVLAAAAMCTERARIGSSVFILGHRNPVVMAKMLTTIDTLSNGRLICGVGVGWWREEFAALGIPFEKRGKRADEMLQVFKALWTQDEPRFHGDFYQLQEVGFAPKPVQQPHPPLWIGGHSQAAYRRAVAFGDGWHASSQTPEQLSAHLDQLRRTADERQRPFDSLELSLRLKLSDDEIEGSFQSLVDLYCAYKQLGLSHVAVDFRRDELSHMLEILDWVATELGPAVEAESPAA